MAAALIGYIAMDVRRQMRRRRQPVPVPLDPNKPYGVYTRAFDVMARGVELDNVLGSACDHHALKQELDEVIAPLRRRHEEAMARAVQRIRDRSAKGVLGDTVVCLLIDHSGSMKGELIRRAAGTAALLSELFDRLGVKHEILGFTTVRWKGGLSRQQWLAAGRSAYPGRLNDLLHIVYRASNDPARWLQLYPMLRNDALKENIDGEAIEWATARLRALPESRKHLIAVSDGAPVDDSTLVDNGPDYLWNHLQLVLDEIEARGDIQLSGIGLDHRVETLFPRSVMLEGPDDLGAPLFALIEQALTADTELGIAPPTLH